MGKQWKQCQTLFWGTPKSLHGDCSHEIKRRLLLGRKVMTNLDSTLKRRDKTQYSIVKQNKVKIQIKKKKKKKSWRILHIAGSALQNTVPLKILYGFVSICLCQHV